MIRILVKVFLSLFCCITNWPSLITSCDLRPAVEPVLGSHRVHHHLDLPLSHHQETSAQASMCEQPVSEDVALRIIKFCNDSIISEREHTTLKLMKVIEGYQSTTRILSDRIANLETASANNDDILERINVVEDKLNTTTKAINVSLEILEDAIANVNLQAHTKNLYQEKLLYSLKHALFDTLSVIKKDNCRTCSSCSQSSPSMIDLDYHTDIHNEDQTLSPAVSSSHVIHPTSSPLQVCKCYKCVNESHQYERLLSIDIFLF